MLFRVNATHESPTELTGGVDYRLVNGMIATDNNKTPAHSAAGC